MKAFHTSLLLVLFLSVPFSTTGIKPPISSNLLVRRSSDTQPNLPVNVKSLQINPMQVQTSVTESIKSVQISRRKFKRQKLFTVFLLRVGFLVLIPLTLLTTALSTAATALFFILRVLTLNFTNRDTFEISMIITRVNMSVILASVAGVLNPIFAVFGLIATIFLSATELMEPLLRMKYRREINRLRHLHRLLSDPVLMETMGILMKSAKTVSDFTVDQASRGVRKIKNQKAEVIDVLMRSSGAEQMVSQFIEQKRLPPAIVNWGREQYIAVRKSGVLEQAASQVVEALQSELHGINSFVPYLEAIEAVRQREMNRKN